MDPCYQLQTLRGDLRIISVGTSGGGLSFGSIKAGAILPRSETESGDASAATGQLRGKCTLRPHHQGARPQGHPPLRPITPLSLGQP